MAPMSEVRESTAHMTVVTAAAGVRGWMVAGAVMRVVLGYGQFYPLNFLLIPTVHFPRSHL